MGLLGSGSFKRRTTRVEAMRRLVLKLWAKASGFTVHPPTEPVPDKCVVIAYPHTTNWDFPAALWVGEQSGVRIKFLGKKQLFRGPMGPIMRGLGGISVERSGKQGLVHAIAAEFAKSDRLHVVVPAEGTRSQVEFWKSGFYRIAQQANVPVLCAYVDGPSNSGGFGLVLHLTGDVSADMDRIRAFYVGKIGLKGGTSSIPRLREEVAQSEK
jgi:1-acyl-sn-glycerol-3-phosphate acyltransferase